VTTIFSPRPLPSATAAIVTERIRAAHEARPFTPLDPRDATRRVAALLDDLALGLTVFRGGLDLRGVEVDHVWLAVAGVEQPAVLDLAFPLFDGAFVEVLRRFVAGDAAPDELDVAGRAAGVEQRVLGAFPLPMRYLGRPVWSDRSGGTYPR
jgi:hypothetical protein